ncbi:MAG: PrsW family intramembrane metalloprotease [Aeromicrobium sp.]
MTIASDPMIAGAPPERREPFRQRGRKALLIGFIFLAVAGVIAFAALLLSGGDGAYGDPELDLAGASLAFALALIPLPVLWLCYWWLDRYEPEPKRYMFAAFVWGGVVAVAIALLLQVWVERTYNLSDESMASFIAPVTEEPAKCLFLLLTFARARRVIDGFLDGLIIAGMVGIGFAFMENFGYYASSYLGGPDIPIDGTQGATTTFIVRGVFSPFAHPLFTSAFGIAVGLAVTRKSKFTKVAISLLGLAVSIGLHMTWNASLSFGGGAGFLLMYVGLGAVLLLVTVMAIIVRSNQVTILEQSLSYVSLRGWIHPAEIPYLSRFTYRKAARRFALQHHGKEARQTVKRYQQLATEMAFLHHAMMSGRSKPHGVERTYGLLDQMYALRPDLRFPPALQSNFRHS